MALNAVRLGSVTDLHRGISWDAERLEKEIRRRIALFGRLGLRPRARAVVVGRRSPAFFADLLAAWRLSICAACVSPSLTPPELQTISGFLEPDVLLVDDTFQGGEGVSCPIVDGEREVGDEEEAAARDGGGLDDPALILFTSGTTGTPKGVVHTFRSIAARVALNRAWIGDVQLERSLCVLPPHFGHGLIGNSLTPLLHGHRLYLGGGVGIDTAARLGDVLVEHEITFLSSVPALWKLVLKLGRPPARPTLRQVGIGSSPLSADLWKLVIGWVGTENVVNMYGITETANWLSGASATAYEPEDGLIGTPWGGAMAVRGEDGDVHRTGEGEILAQTPAVMVGYYRRDDLTGEAIRDGWYHTGDVGHIDEHGVARLTGRRKHEINRAGIKIHPEDIDLLLERHHEVLEACAFGIPDAVSGEIVGVAVRRTEDATADAKALRAWCRERMRADAIPERWFLLEEIPKTDRGKVNRDQVREACLEETKA